MDNQVKQVIEYIHSLVIKEYKDSLTELENFVLKSKMTEEERKQFLVLCEKASSGLTKVVIPKSLPVVPSVSVTKDSVVTNGTNEQHCAWKITRGSNIGQYCKRKAVLQPNGVWECKEHIGRGNNELKLPGTKAPPSVKKYSQKMTPTTQNVQTSNEEINEILGNQTKRTETLNPLNSENITAPNEFTFDD